MKNVSSTEANIALVQSMYAAFGRGDIPAIVAACAPDIAWEVVGPAKDFPLFGVRHGSAEVERFFRQLPEVHAFTEFSPAEVNLAQITNSRGLHLSRRFFLASVWLKRRFTLRK